MDVVSMTLRGRAGAAALRAKYGRDEVAAWMRAGRDRKYLLQVDPRGELPEVERQRRADDARRADMLALAQRSRVARAARKAENDNARIRAIVDPPAVCPVCVPFNERPRWSTSRYCAAHLPRR